MSEDFDEEVVFENSPLFQYLQDLGHTDFEACSPISLEDEAGAGANEPLIPQEIHVRPRKGGVWRLVDALRSLSPLHQDGATCWQEQELDAGFRRSCLRCLLSQDILLQEDVELIELLDPALFSLASTDAVCQTASSAALSRTPVLSASSTWRVFSVIFGLLAVLLGVCVSQPRLELALWPYLLLLLVVSVWCVLAIISVCRRVALRRHVQDLTNQTESLVKNTRALTVLSRKTLRLIQETEVISRGYTLLFDRVSGACGFNRAGHLRSQQLIGLRKAAYHSLRCAFRASRSATCIMLKSFPLNSEIDNVTNYVSTVPIKELGLGLGSELLSDEEAQELTNGYSLPGLKMLFQLWLGQSSEFFRRLALLLSPVHEGSGSLAQLGYKSVPLITDTLQRTLEASLADLQRSFSFHRELQSQQVQRQSLQPQGSISQKRMKDREMELLHSSVRSLQLHLKTLLHEVIIAEDDLDKMTEQNASKESCQEDIQDLLEELQERLRMLEPHVQACSSCWEHTISQLENLLRPKARTNTNSETSDQPEESGVSDPCPVPTITHIQDRDPVPEEQELEAYVSDSDSDSERGFGADISSLSELQRRGRDESKQVLLELKTVLGFRASHDERDKRKRMLFSEHAALAPCAKDTSESAPNEMDTSLMPLNNKLNHEETEPKTQEPDGVTEFICGDSEVCRWDKKDERPAETLLFQSDGLADQGNDGIHSFKVPSLSVMDRLVDLHGSEVVSFASALAAQVAARSCDFTSMKESTYGDSENEEEVTSPEESRESEGE